MQPRVWKIFVVEHTCSYQQQEEQPVEPEFRNIFAEVCYRKAPKFHLLVEYTGCSKNIHPAKEISTLFSDKNFSMYENFR
jgi:hypothetical protein